MKLLRTFRSKWLPVASLLLDTLAGMLLAGAAMAAAPPAAAAPAAAADSVAASAPGAARLTHGRFRDFPVYRPAGAPSGFVLLLSGDDGWSASADAMARQLAQRGAMVAGIDWRQFKANLETDAEQCLFPDGDLENLSHFVQAYFHTSTYLSPVLVGIYSGAAMAYAMLAQAPRNTFAAAMTLDFCPDLNLNKPLCEGSGLEFTHGGRGLDLLPAKSLGNPWVNLEDEAHRSCPAGAAKQFIAPIRGAAMVTLPTVGVPQYTAAYDKLAAQNPTARATPLPAALGGLPVVEVPAQQDIPSDAFALLMSGDGGWAGLDQDVAAALSAKGIPVVGLDSLRYFWTARTPEGLAADTDRLIRYYGTHFGKQRVLLIGYSQGADVLPFAVNRLPEATRARVALTAVMGMSEHALFEFHVSSWISDSNSGPATLPEINRTTGMPVLCIYGADESDSLCPKLDPKKFIIVKLKGGHHFDGDYANLAQQILAAAKP
jgi:type IV secretory pathway VirJ component